jgi:hypothetical protein
MGGIGGWTAPQSDESTRRGVVDSSYGSGGNDKYAALLKALGGGGNQPFGNGSVRGTGGTKGSVDAAGGPELPATTNTATPNARIGRINDAQEARFSGDMGAGAEIRDSSIALRKSKENEDLAARQRSAAMGGGGASDVGQFGRDRALITSTGGANASILNDAERRRDALGGQIVGQEATSEGLQQNQLSGNRAQQQLALQAQQQASTERMNQQQLQIAHQQAQQQAINNQLSIFKDLFGGEGIFG